MKDAIRKQILEHVAAEGYTPSRPRQIAKALEVDADAGGFRDALRDLMDEGRIVTGSAGNVLMPAELQPGGEFIGSYRHNQKGFGFVVPSDPNAHEDLFIPPGNQNGALTGDLVRARIKEAGKRNGRDSYAGTILEVLERKHSRFVGTLSKVGENWVVYPDGSAMTDPILTPDAAGKYIKPGTKVVVEITQYPDDTGRFMRGVISDTLGKQGEKDVDLKSIIIQHGLPEEFPQEVKDAASDALKALEDPALRANRFDMTDQTILTIDPPDAKDYDDAISLRHTDDGLIELGVHIADVSTFVKPGNALDLEAHHRGNSTYFPGHVIPMLPEVLSNGVCSLQEGVPRFAKSVFITYDKFGKPVRTAFSNSLISSAARLRYIEAQAIIDGEATIPHPDGDRTLDDYQPNVVELLLDMNRLAKTIQKRRREQGQLVLDLPQIELVLDGEGKVTGTTEEDDSFTHTLIEMFMVEANEASARLYDKLGVPYLRRVHPGPDPEGEERLVNFVRVAGHQLPKDMDRHALQALLGKVRGKPEQFAINLAILRSISRAEYSPKQQGHFALASDNYCHFTSPIRRYADLTVHRLLDDWFKKINADFRDGPIPAPRGQKKTDLNSPTYDELVELGRHISFTERRSEAAERELKQVKVLELLSEQIGNNFDGVVTGITNFGVFVQISEYLVDGLCRYEDLMDDWWDVDAKNGRITGQRSGMKIQIGDVVDAKIINVDVAGRELSLSIADVKTRGMKPMPVKEKKKPKKKKDNAKPKATGSDKRAARSKSRDKRKKNHRRK
ncbi:MAG: ribonuclease R [Planctomycetota bacterium]